MKFKIKFFFVIIPILGILYLNTGFLFLPERKINLQISKYKSLKISLKKLKSQKIIKSFTFFYLASILSGKDKKIQPGYYTFSSRQSSLKILDILATGASDLVSVVIKEGFDIYDIDNELFLKKIILKKGDFLKFAQSQKNRDLISNMFKVNGVFSLEGFLYPDTYRLKLGDSLDVFIEMALENFNEKIYKEYLKLNSKNKESLILYLKVASLVEKESSVLEEKPLISAVFYNRLKVKEKLRCDPTIIYALKVNGLYNSNLKNGVINIKKRHFSLRSRYNTYYFKGLPKGPICSPTKSSFLAALFPAKTNYFFFVAKGGSQKGHYFSVTYEDHKNNIKKYLRARKGHY